MKKIILHLLIFTSICITLNAQQDAQYTQYQFNTLVLNPAYAGSRGTISATAFYRNQWMNIEGAPNSMAASIHAPIKNRVGIGLTLESDKIGPIENYVISANYAYQIPLEIGRLAMGIKASLTSYNALYSTSQTVTQGDIAFQQDIKSLLPNFGAGIYYFTDNFVMGVAVPRLLENKITSTGENNITKITALNRHYYATIGSVLALSEQIKFKPTVLVKYVPNTPLVADIGANILLKDAFGVGVSYRTQTSWNFSLLYQLKNGWRIGYAYDYAITDINQFSGASHEFMLGIEVPKQKSVIVTPRYF